MMKVYMGMERQGNTGKMRGMGWDIVGLEQG